MKKITIIVPCYNEEDVLDSFYEEIQKWFNPNYDMNLLFVNDGSKDKTLEIIKKFAKDNDKVKYISFSRNFGKEAAMQAGLAKCKDKDAVIIMDADLQHPPHLIPKMIENWENGYNIVYTKFSSRKHRIQRLPGRHQAAGPVHAPRDRGGLPDMLQAD